MGGQRLEGSCGGKWCGKPTWSQYSLMQLFVCKTLNCIGYHYEADTIVDTVEYSDTNLHIYWWQVGLIEGNFRYMMHFILLFRNYFILLKYSTVAP